MKGNKAKSFLILSVTLCLVLGIVTYMYIYTPQVEKTKQLETSNFALASRVEVLIAFNEKMNENLDQINMMTADIQDRLKDFPAEVREEDEIALALHSLNNGIKVAYPSISFGEKNVLASIPAATVQGAGIEGMDQEIRFIFRDATYDTVTVYEELRKLVTCFNENQEELAISELSFSTDQKGPEVKMPVVLNGTIKTTFYSAMGTGKEYVPKEFKAYELGMDGLFNVNNFKDGLFIVPEELGGGQEEQAVE